MSGSQAGRMRPARVPAGRRAVRRQVRPTLRGALFLGVGIVVFITAWAFDIRDLLFLGSVLLLVPLLSLGYVLVHPLRVAVARTFRPGTVSAGLPATVSVQVRNLASVSLPGLRWRDLAAGGISVPAVQPLPVLGPARRGRGAGSDTASVSYLVRPLRRGVYALGPLMLGRADPFGLAYSEWPAGAPHDLTVTPTVWPLPGSGVSITRGEGSRHERLRHLNNDSDELIAREYRPGDPMRRVNWPATARHGEIMIRQEEQRSHPEARMVLDTGRGGRAEGRENDAEFERAVELTASIAVHLIDAGFRLDVVELGPSQLAPNRSVAAGTLAPRDPDAGRRGGLHGDDPASFTGPEGALALVDALAQIAPQDRAGHPGTEDGPGDARRNAAAFGRQIPTFAVLIDIDDPDVTALAALRGLCQPAVAFVFDTLRGTALERLAEAGWQCVPVTAATGVDAAWAQVGQDRAEAR